MNKQAYVHSIHSQVPNTLRSIDFFPDLIISFDSHLDFHIGSKEEIDAYPDHIKSIALRSCAHTHILRIYRELPILTREDNYIEYPEMNVIIPKVCLNNEIATISDNLSKVDPNLGYKNYRKGKRSINRIYNTMYGVSLHEAPPSHPLDIFKKGDFYEDVLVDLDVDYCAEFQSECYTPIKHAQHSDLGMMVRFLKFIRIIEPPIITISEITVNAINESKSNFQKFINNLEDLKYEIQFCDIFKDDEIVKDNLNKYEEFQTKIMKPLMAKYNYQTLENGFRNELIKSIKKFF